MKGAEMIRKCRPGTSGGADRKAKNHLRVEEANREQINSGE
jgi:hypothetical protein